MWTKQITPSKTASMIHSDENENIPQQKKPATHSVKREPLKPLQLNETPSIIKYSLYSPDSKKARNINTSSPYLSVSEVLGEQYSDQLITTFDFLDNMIHTISVISQNIKNPELQEKMSVFVADLSEIKNALNRVELVRHQLLGFLTK